MQRLFRHVRRRPHFFNVVEGADFRAEHVNDDVAGIDQHPVSGLETFSAGVSEPLRRCSQIAETCLFDRPETTTM
jgi:hypothetical protein